MTDPLDEQIIGLNTAVNIIAEKTRDLADTQAGQISAIRKALHRITILTVVMFVLLLGTLFVGYRSYSNANAIRKSQQNITTIQHGAICPVLDSLLSGYDITSPTAIKDPVLYNQRYTNYENGAKLLHCEHIKRGPQ